MLAAHSLLSLRPEIFVQVTWGIFKLTLNSENLASMSCIHFGKLETAQQELSSSYAADYVLHLCQLYTKYFLHVTINFTESIAALSRLCEPCVPSAPSDFRAPENKAKSMRVCVC